MVLLRSFGKVAFFRVQDASGRMQCYASREDMGEAPYALFKKFDIGDIVGVTGKLFRTKTGELTLACTSVRLLTKSMRPLPEKYHGLKDVEIRYRQRYVDLIVTPRTAEIFKIRTKIVSEMRRFFDERGLCRGGDAHDAGHSGRSHGQTVSDPPQRPGTCSSTCALRPNST